MLYTKPPHTFSPQMDVVGCYVICGDAILLLHRHGHKSNGGLWGLPAGKREEGETLEGAMSRELKEETGLIVSVSEIRYLESVFVRHHQRDFVYSTFSLSYTLQPEIHINTYEHQSFAWVRPEEAFNLPLVNDQDTCMRRFCASFGFKMGAK